LCLSFGSKISKNFKNLRVCLEVDCLAMEERDNPYLDCLLDFIESPTTVIDDTDFDVSEQDLDLDQLWSSLESDKVTVNSNQDSDAASTHSDSQLNPNIVDDDLALNIHEEIKIEEKVITIYNLIQIAPNQFMIDSQVLLASQCHNNILPLVLTDSYSSTTSLMSSTSSCPSSPTSDLASTSSGSRYSQKKSILTDDYKEVRRKNNESCEKYKRKKRENENNLEKELQALEARNTELSVNVRVMEGIVKDLRERYIREICNGGKKRKSDDCEDEPSKKMKKLS